MLAIAPGANAPSGRAPRIAAEIIRGWIMDYFFFFAGLAGTIAALLIIKKTSPNQH